MSEVQDLIAAYEDILRLPWQKNLSPKEKVWFVVYDPNQERRIRLRLPEFELKTTENGYKWKLIDITDSFAHWMANIDYREAYFTNPGDMDPMLDEFTNYVINNVRLILSADDVDENTIMAISGISSLFGLTYASKVIDSVTSEIKGRLLVFFPGRYDGSVYRLMDARDGWNYLAVPITAK